MPINEFVICGPPRSGTTAICTVLNDCKNFFVFNELNCYTSTEERLREVLPAYLEQEDNVHFLKARNINLLDLIERAKNKPHNIPLLLNMDTNIPFVGDKSPFYILPECIECILSRRPNIKFIFTIRDCRAVVASSIRAYRNGKTGPWVYSTIEQAANMWQQCILSMFSAMEQLQSNQYHVIRYERAVEKPRKMLDELSMFFETEIAINNPVENIFVPTNLESWKEELKGGLGNIPKNVLQTMRVCGYY